MTREVFYSFQTIGQLSSGYQWQFVTPSNQNRVSVKWIWVDAQNSNSYALQTIAILSNNDGNPMDAVMDDNGAGTMVGNGLKLYASDRAPFKGRVMLRQGELYILDVQSMVITGLPASGDYNFFVQMILEFE